MLVDLGMKFAIIYNRLVLGPLLRHAARLVPGDVLGLGHVLCVPTLPEEST